MSLASDGFGGLAGAAAAELHLKMSKKIAQLTKVIFHLNTRNEDFQSDFAHAKHAHARELAQLTQDAAAKMRQLHEQLQAQSRAAQLAERRADSERQQAQHQLAELQRRAGAGQSAAEQSFRQRVAQLETQVEATERAFSDRAQQLVRLAESQQQSASQSASAALAAARSAHAAAVTELAAKKDDEITQLVTASNAKFNQMLAEQLRAHDALRDASAASVAALEQQLGAAKSEHAAQAAAAEKAARSQFDEMTHRLVSKTETVLADAEQLRGHEAKLRAEKEALLQTQSELQRRLKQLELQVAQAQQEAQSARRDADAHTQRQQQLLSAGAERIDELACELGALKKTLQTQDEALRQAQQALAIAQLETLQHSASLSEKDALLRQHAQERELQLAELHAAAQRSQHQRALAETELQARIRALEALAEAAARDRGDASAKLVASELQRTQLQAALADWQAKSDESDRRARQLERERVELGAAHAAALQRQQSEADAQLHALELELQQRSSEALAGAVAQLKSEHAKALGDLKAAADAAQLPLTLEVANLAAQLKTLQGEAAAADKELRALRARAADLSAQLKREQEKLASALSDKDAQLKASERARREKEDALAKQLRELGDQREAATKKLTAEKEQLQLQHSQTLAALAREHEAKLKRLSETSEVQAQAQLVSQAHELTDQYERLVAALKGDLLVLQTQLEREAHDAQETQRVALESRSLDHEGHVGSVLRLVAQLEAQCQREEEAAQLQLRASREQHAEELEQLAARLAAESRHRLESAHKDTELRVAQLITSHRDALEQRSQHHALALKELGDRLETQRWSELLALRTETTQHARELAAQKDRERADALREAQARHDAAVGSLQSQAEQLQSQLAQTARELSSSVRAAERLSSALDAKTKEAAERVAALERAGREQVETLKRAAKQDMDRLLEENLAETKLLSDQFEETRRLMADKVTLLKQAVAEWEERYARRESRPEDVSRLAELGRLVAEKDALVRQTLDEMAYFKRELLNREEMYNKMFARAPNVGVLNVLKPHVQLQAQMQAPTPQGGLGLGGSAAPQTKRKTKPAHAGGGPETQAQELQRRNSERASSSSGTGIKKSLPPLQNNQVAM
ncbi:hypothetical protein PybrP1_002313 [[Pythium] brassicae (nom. inval.)]|nr:hypothetical protein PybrP1_002313 [[Pythium] brassicae (nom. inval.)]